MAKKRQDGPHVYRFKIDAYSPETMPLGRLAEYLADLSVLFGEDQNVHLIKIEKSSTVPVVLVDREAEPKVRERLNAVVRRDAPPEAMRAAASIDEKLRKDNAKGKVIAPTGDNLIVFPGKDHVEPLIYGPFTQPGIIIGMPIMVGGKNDPVPVHLQTKDGVYDCLARRERAREIASYLFTTYIEAEGIGRWIRHSTGEWEMKSFRIGNFKPLEYATLRDTIKKLRAVPAKWKEKEDPLSELRDLRHVMDG